MKIARYRIVNEFHKYRWDTSSENPKTIAARVRESKPKDCQSHTLIYELDADGVYPIARVEIVNGEIRVYAQL